ncbi:hypothetical protein Cgig2_015781 [Carnegiea gigantea]|uniref:Cytochrome P450 n=1 Tax=Carnegiea gigantea TaxID=171969 RepID=A0A9Q1KH80_9CARY|nr:hypothetical protein Cgig2_015781 [Carnegiea gigantea]
MGLDGVLLGLPLVGWLLWLWNEIWFVTPIKAKHSSMYIKMFPGHLGFPFFGEMLTFLWYFKILHRLDDFIYSKILIPFEGTHHDRVKSLLINAIKHPHALARIAIHVQPAIATLLNMRRYFASLDFGPQHHSIEQMLFAKTQGFRAQPSKIPGSAYHYAVKCRTKFKNIMRVELEKRKQQNKSANEAKHLMDELMQKISTAYLSTWALYFVAKDPNVLHKLREENIELAKDKKDRFVRYTDIRPKVGTFYAFGGGWKSCLGNMFGQLQLIILLHHLSIGYKRELLNSDVKLRYLLHPIPTDDL